ncbi:MAG: sigma-70 family RNA polymerase sigma factor [Phycisphaerae bacterium]|nr:sigma-70 family RNA polymerase sigma factor [Phycisphaerae bacterium]
MAKNASRTSLDWYLDHIKSTPLLTATEEKQLARRVREHSDPIAREQMIAANLRLVVKIAKEYSNPGMTLGDLVAEGNLGLMRAVEEFDPDAGVRFSTYAAWWIKQTIKKALINAGQPIHVPAYLSKLISKWRRGEAEIKATLGRSPTVEEMAKVMKISRKKAGIIRQGFQAVSAPLQMGTDSSPAIAEMIADKDNSPDKEMLKASDIPIVQSLLGRLEPRERQILELRFALDGYEGPTRTYKQIGKIVGLTRERVRQLEKQALAQLNEIIDEML